MARVEINASNIAQSIMPYKTKLASFFKSTTTNTLWLVIITSLYFNPKGILSINKQQLLKLQKYSQ